MRNTAIIEAARYSSHLLPLKSDIYRNGSHSYSNLKILLMNREIHIPKVDALKTGILSEIQAFWYVTQHNLTYTLNIFRYDLNSLESLPSFESNITFVKIFKPIKGIFNPKIQFCMAVVTESDIIMYGIENDTLSIINTDFSAKLYSKASCVEIRDGNIFLGCYDGNVYHAIYKSIDFLNYKYLNLYSPGNTFIKSISSIFSKKKNKISHISVGKKYLVSLSKSIVVYNIECGIYKVYEIPVDTCYSHVQIVEENPLLFYCVQSTGTRDFFSTEKLFSKDAPLIENSELSKKIYSNDTKLLSIRSDSEKSSFVFVSFNEDQLRNFSRSKPVESFEVLTLYKEVIDADLSDSNLYVITPGSIIHYSVLDAKKFLMNCRTQETYLMYKNYGDVEFMIKYFQLLTENEDVSKLDGLCKNDSIKSHALFVWIYSLIRSVWSVDLYTLKTTHMSEDVSLSESELDDVIKKLKVLKQRLDFGYEAAKSFIDEFIETNFFTTLLVDYNITFRESFESILTRDSDFKIQALKDLLNTFTLNQSIEPLLKTMQNNCPGYLPLEHINMQRGLQLVKKDDRDSLMRSLNYFSQAKFDAGIIHKFNEHRFYYGSVFLIREKFDFDYETAISLFNESVKCKRAFNHGLEDSREAFLYPFFESLLNLESFSPCVCCDSTPSIPDLLSISNPLFKVFLKDQFHRNEKTYDLYWKYLLIKNERLEAIQVLLNLTQRIDIPIQKKIDFLQTALSISSGTHLNTEVKLRLRLYEIQKELISRDPSLKTSVLLDSDTLYNDYCQDYVDLKIKVLDAINYKDKAEMRNLYELLFKDMPLRDCLLFLKEINNKKLEIVFDILVKKIKPSVIDFCTGLAMAGFEYDEILSSVKDSLESSIGPDIKVELLKSLKTFSKHGEYHECERMCEKTFGIRVYK